jgi:hypothetical protein
MRDNPSSVLSNVVNDAYTADPGHWAGGRWPDGAPAFTGHTTILGPNKGSFTQGGWDGEDGIYEPSSHHVGGVLCLLGDGSVTFISENIDTGDLTCPVPDTDRTIPANCGSRFGPSPYGIWGALGSVDGHETVGEF